MEGQLVNQFRTLRLGLWVCEEGGDDCEAQGHQAEPDACQDMGAMMLCLCCWTFPNWLASNDALQ